MAKDKRNWKKASRKVNTAHKPIDNAPKPVTYLITSPNFKSAEQGGNILVNIGGRIYSTYPKVEKLRWVMNLSEKVAGEFHLEIKAGITDEKDGLSTIYLLHLRKRQNSYALEFKLTDYTALETTPREIRLNPGESRRILEKLGAYKRLEEEVHKEYRQPVKN